jgi:hypothetical protein
MKNTKWLRRALLGGAALSVMATGAQADELSALKAQLEALQSRVSQLETQPAPQLPEGTKLLTVRRGQGTYSMLAAQPAADRLQEGQGYTIAITPTADMPAPVSEVTVSGEIRVLAVFRDLEIDGDTIDLNGDDDTAWPEEHDGWENSDFDIATRARLRVDGKTETAIGEVGGTIRLEGQRNNPGGVSDGFDDTSSDVTLSIGWGYWQMTPNFQLGGGYWDSAAAIQAGWDWNGETALTGLNLANGAGPTNTSVSQVRLTYSNGPLTAAVSVEDNNRRGNWADFDEGGEDLDSVLNDDAVFPAVAGFITFDSGSFLVTASAVWEADDTDEVSTGDQDYSFVDTDDNWMVGIGAIVRISDMFRLEGAANIGEGYTPGIYGTNVCGDSFSSLIGPGDGGRLGPDCENDMGYWGANGLAVISFAEHTRLEIGAAYSNLDHERDELGDSIEDSVDHQWTAAASMFWDPVDQLTLGAGVGFSRQSTDDDDDETDADVFHAGFGAWFRF